MTTTPAEPPQEEVLKAWTAAIQLEGIPGAGREAEMRLRALRDAKTTWFDTQELGLRRSVDAWLRARAA